MGCLPEYLSGAGIGDLTFSVKILVHGDDGGGLPALFQGTQATLHPPGHHLNPHLNHHPGRRQSGLLQRRVRGAVTSGQTGQGSSAGTDRMSPSPLTE